MDDFVAEEGQEESYGNIIRQKRCPRGTLRQIDPPKRYTLEKDG